MRKEYHYRRHPVWRKPLGARISEIIFEIGIGICLLGFWAYFWLAPWGA